MIGTARICGGEFFVGLSGIDRLGQLAIQRQRTPIGSWVFGTPSAESARQSSSCEGIARVDNRPVMRADGHRAGVALLRQVLASRGGLHFVVRVRPANEATEPPTNQRSSAFGTTTLLQEQI